METLEHLIQMTNLCEVHKECEIKSHFAEGKARIDEHYSQYPQIEVQHTGSAVEDLYLPLYKGTQLNTDLDHMIVVMDISIMELSMVKKPVPFTNLSENDSKTLVLINTNNPGYVHLVPVNKMECFKEDLNVIKERSLKCSDFINDCQTKYPPIKVRNALNKHKTGAISGPSVVQTGIDVQLGSLFSFGSHLDSRDVVYCIQLPSLPEIAQSWKERLNMTKEPGSWPSEELLQQILNSPCHVVPVGSHTSSNKDIEWRLSFSFIEKLLILSLNPAYRKACSILKAVVKASKAKDTIKSYYIKTTLLWLCESHKGDIVSDSVIAVGEIIYRILQKLISFLMNFNLPNYFVAENNMISHVDRDTIEAMVKVLEDIESRLSEHLVNFIQSEISTPVVFESSMLVEISKGHSNIFDAWLKYNLLAISLYIFFHDQICQNSVNVTSSFEYLQHAKTIHMAKYPTRKFEFAFKDNFVTYISIMRFLQECLLDDIGEEVLGVEHICSIIHAIFHVICLMCVHRNITAHEELKESLHLLAEINETFNSSFLDDYNNHKLHSQPSITVQPKEVKQTKFDKLLLSMMIQIVILKKKNLASFFYNNRDNGGNVAFVNSDFENANAFLTLGLGLLNCCQYEAFVVLKIAAFARGIQFFHIMLSLSRQEHLNKSSKMNLLKLLLNKEVLSSKLSPSQRQQLEKQLQDLQEDATSVTSQDSSVLPHYIPERFMHS